MPQLAEHDVRGVLSREKTDHGLAARTHARELDRGGRVRVIQIVRPREESACFLAESLIEEHPAEIHVNDRALRRKLEGLAAELFRLSELPPHTDAVAVVREIGGIIVRDSQGICEKRLRQIESPSHNARLGPAKKLLRLEGLIQQIRGRGLSSFF